MTQKSGCHVFSAGQEVSWDDFLPSLSYVMVECNRPHILIEVEYMMELLEPSWLGGEGSAPSSSFAVDVSSLQMFLWSRSRWLLPDQRVRQPASDPESGPGAAGRRLPDAGGAGGAEGVELQAEPRGPDAEGAAAESGGSARARSCLLRLHRPHADRFPSC